MTARKSASTKQKGKVASGKSAKPATPARKAKAPKKPPAAKLAAGSRLAKGAAKAAAKRRGIDSDAQVVNVAALQRRVATLAKQLAEARVYLGRLQRFLSTDGPDSLGSWLETTVVPITAYGGRPIPQPPVWADKRGNDDGDDRS